MVKASDSSSTAVSNQSVTQLRGQLQLRLAIQGLATEVCVGINQRLLRLRGLKCSGYTNRSIRVYVWVDAATGYWLLTVNRTSSHMQTKYGMWISTDSPIRIRTLSTVAGGKAGNETPWKCLFVQGPAHHSALEPRF